MTYGILWKSNIITFTHILCLRLWIVCRLFLKKSPTDWKVYYGDSKKQWLSFVCHIRQSGTCSFSCFPITWNGWRKPGNNYCNEFRTFYQRQQVVYGFVSMATNMFSFFRIQRRYKEGMQLHWESKKHHSVQSYDDEYATFLKHYQQTLNKKGKWGNEVYCLWHLVATEVVLFGKMR